MQRNSVLTSPLQKADVPTPLEFNSQNRRMSRSGWKELNTEQKIAVIVEVIQKNIRPYIELDAGGIVVLKFRQ